MGVVIEIIGHKHIPIVQSPFITQILRVQVYIVEPVKDIDGDVQFPLTEGFAGDVFCVVRCRHNDRGYGILRFIQDLMVEGRRTGVDLSTPEFAPMAAAFGMRSAAVSSAAEFADVFAKAVDSGEPWLLDVDITSMEPMTIQPTGS